jgi:hypothetical protein
MVVYTSTFLVEVIVDSVALVFQLVGKAWFTRCICPSGLLVVIMFDSVALFV